MTLTLAVFAVALVTVGVVLLIERARPVTPHPDISKIQWPVAADPTIIVERRE